MHGKEPYQTSHCWELEPEILMQRRQSQARHDKDRQFLLPFPTLMWLLEEVCFFHLQVELLINSLISANTYYFTFFLNKRSSSSTQNWLPGYNKLEIKDSPNAHNYVNLKYFNFKIKFKCKL